MSGGLVLFFQHVFSPFAENFAIRISRGNRVGEMGYDIHVGSEHSVALYNKIMSIGTDFDLSDAGFRAFNSLSCEKGYSTYLLPTCEFYFLVDISFPSFHITFAFTIFHS